MILKNIKKVFFDESLTANQDLDFGINMVENGFKVFRLKDTGILINNGKSAMFDNPMQRLVRKTETLQKIIIKWGIKEYR